MALSVESLPHHPPMCLSLWSRLWGLLRYTGLFFPVFIFARSHREDAEGLSEYLRVFYSCPLWAYVRCVVLVAHTYRKGRIRRKERGKKDLHLLSFSSEFFARLPVIPRTPSCILLALSLLWRPCPFSSAIPPLLLLLAFFLAFSRRVEICVVPLSNMPLVCVGASWRQRVTVWSIRVFVYYTPDYDGTNVVYSCGPSIHVGVFCVRSSFFPYKATIQRVIRGHLGRLRVQDRLAEFREYQRVKRACVKIQASWRRFKAMEHCYMLRCCELLERERWTAATRIQAYWKMRVQRDKYRIQHLVSLRRKAKGKRRKKRMR